MSVRPKDRLATDVSPEDIKMAIRYAGKFAREFPSFEAKELTSIALEALVIASFDYEDHQTDADGNHYSFRQYAALVIRGDLSDAIRKHLNRQKWWTNESPPNSDEERGEWPNAVSTSNPEAEAEWNLRIAALDITDQEIVKYLLEGFTQPETAKLAGLTYEQARHRIRKLQGTQ